MPRSRCTKAAWVKKGATTPTCRLMRRARARASALGTNPSVSMAVCTRCRVLWFTVCGAFSTRETVAMLTPAWVATS